MSFERVLSLRSRLIVLAGSDSCVVSFEVLGLCSRCLERVGVLKIDEERMMLHERYCYGKVDRLIRERRLPD